jgi:hypothetical protein
MTKAAVLTSLFILASALPLAAANAQERKTRPAVDLNEKVCEDIVYTGSRLGVKRVCATRAEWAERRRLDKEAIDRAQVSPCMVTTTGGTGRPSC